MQNEIRSYITLPANPKSPKQTVARKLNAEFLHDRYASAPDDKEDSDIPSDDLPEIPCSEKDARTRYGQLLRGEIQKQLPAIGEEEELDSDAAKAFKHQDGASWTGSNMSGFEAKTDKLGHEKHSLPYEIARAQKPAFPGLFQHKLEAPLVRLYFKLPFWCI